MANLSDNETLNYLIAWKENKDAEALNSLMKANRPLIYFWVSRFSGYGVDQEDLVSAGWEKLYIAINRFDYQHHNIKKFSSYISLAIMHGIQREIKVQLKHQQVISLDTPITKRPMGNLTYGDLLGTDSGEVIDTVISKIKNEHLRILLMSLTPKQRLVIFLRYGLDDGYKKTLNEVANELNSTYRAVWNLEQKGLVKLRKNVNELKIYYDE